MKKLFLFIGFICITLTVSFAQNKKAEKAAAAKEQFEKAVAAIEAKDFVIIVDTYESSDGTIETNTDDGNFLSYETEFVFLQGAIVAGNNYTNKVTVSDYKQVTDKKGNIRIQMQCKGSMIAAKVEIFLKRGGNYADVIVSPTWMVDSSLKNVGSASPAKGEVLQSRGSESALPSMGDAFSSSRSDASSKNGGTKRFSGEIIPRAQSKYFKRPGVV